MSTTTKSGSRSGDVSLIVRSDWGVGPRTAAWDRLWRMILSDIGAIPATDARQALESEVGDA
jgi:hypothetical protein